MRILYVVLMSGRFSDGTLSADVTGPDRTRRRCEAGGESRTRRLARPDQRPAGRRAEDRRLGTAGTRGREQGDRRAPGRSPGRPPLPNHDPPRPDLAAEGAV